MHVSQTTMKDLDGFSWVLISKVIVGNPVVLNWVQEQGRIVKVVVFGLGVLVTVVEVLTIGF